VELVRQTPEYRRYLQEPVGREEAGQVVYQQVLPAQLTQVAVVAVEVIILGEQAVQAGRVL
jgi:hypothetical protein